jgi:hypothetical protein
MEIRLKSNDLFFSLKFVCLLLIDNNNQKSLSLLKVCGI